MTDTLFADISEFQVPLNNSYPYQVLSIRVCDGTYQDHYFAATYVWMRGALGSGRVTFRIAYSYVGSSARIDLRPKLAHWSTAPGSSAVGRFP